MTPWQLQPLLLAAIALTKNSVASQHTWSDSFPSNDEWDHRILDPIHVFGSPYGGYSRATRSRLASLPLRLPGVTDSSPKEEDETYYEVSDGRGRKYVCRSYHEDELESSSLGDSMFDTAVEKDASLEKEELHQPQEQVDSKQQTQESTRSADEGRSSENDGAPDTMHEKSIADAPEEGDSDPDSNQKDKGESKGSSDGDATISTDVDGADGDKQVIEQRLLLLDGICAQTHNGWWSYEWCHGETVSQFHFEVTQSRNNADPTIAVEDLTVLGEFAERRIQLTKDTAYVGETRPLGEVFDYFRNGDTCPDTGKPREIEVRLHCCRPKKNKKNGKNVLFGGKKFVSDIASIRKLTESKTCQYHASICTPLLCDSEDFWDSDGFGLGLKKPEEKPRPRKEDESIRETLERSLSINCLKTGNGGWWEYEFCHGRHIRQFHDATMMDALTGLASKVTETQHVLGLYFKEELESFPDEEEVDHVVNITDSLDAGHSSGSSGSFDKGVAYFVQEYRGGDVCDHSDVTDAAIKAGNVGTGGVERSTTVRFFCGKRLELVRVDEDSTCHYVIDVTVPDLCFHPLFKKPIQKKKVVKCLPVEDPNPQPQS